MSRKPSLLASALKTSEPETTVPVGKAPTEPKAAAVTAPREQRAEHQSGVYVPPSRANKTAKTHHLPPAYWETLEEISFRTRDEKGKRVPQERLVAEALNLLFVKYNYPQVRDE